MKRRRGGITAPHGFTAAGVHCGLKKQRDLLDLALVLSDRPGPMAGVFTTNRVVAAPVVIDREHLRQGRGRVLLVNSGCANVCTGRDGMAAAKIMVRLCTEAFDVPAHQVFIGSTGVIGAPLAINKIVRAFPALVTRLRRAGANEAARAIMTTDTHSKETALSARINGTTVTVAGMAKGSGMIHPNMATMLAYVTTDAVIAQPLLQTALSRAVEQTFNCISVDGDTSTNDTVLCLANGLAKNRAIRAGSPGYRAFQRLLTEACAALALLVGRDGEGITKFVEIRVRGASTDADAKQVANTVGTSCLVKTALFGQDANWGRIVAAIGRAGVPIRPERISLRIGGVLMLRHGAPQGVVAERRIAKVFKQREFPIEIDLGMGSGTGRLWTTDLSYDYVRINASYRS